MVSKLQSAMFEERTIRNLIKIRNNVISFGNVSVDKEKDGEVP